MKRILTLLLLAATFLAVLADASNGGPEMKMPGVVELSDSNFDEHVGSVKAAFVLFYAPWCNYCKALAPTYAKVGDAFQRSERAKDLLVLGKVDVTQQRNVREKMKIVQYPTLLYFPPGSTKPEKFSGIDTVERFVQFLNEKIPNAQIEIPKEVDHTVNLNAENFDAIVKDPTKSVFVMFFAPWCTHCTALKPNYKRLASVYQNDADVVIALIDATIDENKPIAEKYKVSGYPTLLFFRKGDAVEPEEYKGGREVEALTNFVNARSGAQRLSNGELSIDIGVNEELSKAVAAVASADGVEASAATIEVVRSLAAKHAASSSAAYYVKVAERIADKGIEFVSKELARLQHLLQGDVRGERRDDMLTRTNILTSISNHL
ncbi:putative protein disulfide isomerase [Leptomonas seymouri]|uniref:protein disulfide-isomerase n=1 Tax=Leptomonas seymouri TaxID=5684 RepID=A0A0N1HVU7_LEPSE|nr:putative protein disulfide isomerase [Leptomonas seymouri]|eukprot:KPI85981.1 putative protein disulfide isomerase [Leptomonas seymouri]